MKEISRNQFETDFEASATDKIAIFKQRDVFIPQTCRECKKSKINLPPNKFDFIIYSEPKLLTVELKSTKDKSVSFNEKIIKKHQIDNLKKYAKYPGIISGFIFNFAEYDNQTYFLPITKFIEFKETTDRKSIPLDYIASNGVEIKHRLKVKNYKYFLDEFVNNFK